MFKNLDEVKKAFGAELFEKISPDNLGFSILNVDSSDNEAAIKSEASERAMKYSWSSEDSEFILSIGKLKSCPREDMDAILEKFIEGFLPQKGEIEFYAMRNYTTDDMFCVELAGVVVEGEVSFYASILSDGVSGYAVAGATNASIEEAFAEFAAASRSFYRGDKPATVEHGKSEAAEVKKLRAISAILFNEMPEGYSSINVTFDIENGEYNEDFAVIAVNEDGGNFEEIENFNKDPKLNNAVREFISMLEDRFDVAGFTLTCFEDGRYSATFYPIYEEEDLGAEEAEAHSHGCSCGGECNDDDCECEEGDDCACGHADYKDGDKEDDGTLDRVLVDVASKTQKLFAKDWTEASFLFKIDEETFDYSLDIYSSSGKAFKSIPLSEAAHKEFGDLFEILFEALDNDFEIWNAFCFHFKKDEKSGAPAADTFSYEVFYFDLFLDGKDEKDAGEFAFLKDYASLFSDELDKAQRPFANLSFELVKPEGKPAVIDNEPAVSLSDGMEEIEISEAKKKKVLSLADKVFAEFSDNNVLLITFFPNNKVGLELSCDFLDND